MQKYRHVEGFYGLHTNMPVTPRAIALGYANGGNALSLESTENRILSSMSFSSSFLLYAKRLLLSFFFCCFGDTFC